MLSALRPILDPISRDPTLKMDVASLTTETDPETVEIIVENAKDKINRILDALVYFASIAESLPIDYSVWVNFFSCFFLNGGYFIQNYATKFELFRLEFDKDSLLVNHSLSHEKMLIGGLAILRTICGVILFRPEIHLTQHQAVSPDIFQYSSLQCFL